MSKKLSQRFKYSWIDVTNIDQEVVITFLRKLIKEGCSLFKRLSYRSLYYTGLQSIFFFQNKPK
ncbi:hypothetical protein D1012_15635 [Pseudotabrizicola alkalilacus]|uniref:Uncharacterized protein n=1 Tax=Pseudotabrizicola alkalilacus TaxID=2305252 RepID=A0A411YZH8_9RHOB|nr:hypothetical protein D1012_15635 [Pseudotabrizicola alkalilacus]